MHKILMELHQDHLNLTRVFGILDQQLDRIASNNHPDLFLCVDILHYIQHYPDLFHHPKENIVYDVLKHHTTDAKDIIHQLEDEHQSLPQETETLKDILESAANSVLFVSRDVLTTKIADFLKLERKHMDLEEEVVFPLIDKAIPDNDWLEIEKKVESTIDPLFGSKVQTCYQNLYDSIKAQAKTSI